MSSVEIAKTAQLILVPAGETSHSAEDSELSPEALKVARQTGRQLADLGIYPEVAYVPLYGAAAPKTVQAIISVAPSMSPNVITDHRLRARKYGQHITSRAHMQSQLSEEEFELLHTLDKPDRARPGGDSLNNVFARLRPFLRDANNRLGPDGNGLVVADPVTLANLLHVIDPRYQNIDLHANVQGAIMLHRSPNGMSNPTILQQLDPSSFLQ